MTNVWKLRLTREYVFTSPFIPGNVRSENKCSMTGFPPVHTRESSSWEKSLQFR
jgi:hypothetical protein